MPFGHTERLAAALVARHELSEAVQILNEIGILPMPLKGVLLQQTVYSDPAERVISDADLLVPARRGEDALDALKDRGYRFYVRGRAGVTGRAPKGELDVDVHWRLFPPGLYALRSSEMFARGRIDEKLFGGVVVLPDPLDVYAHLVGNFAKGRHGAENPDQIRDFSAVASVYGLPPRTVARHLERHGLSRAARYALPFAVEAGDDHAARVLATLRRDPVGRASATVARRITERFGGDARVSLLAPHLVNRSLARGAVSVAAHVAIGLKARVEKRSRSSGYGRSDYDSR